MWVLEHGNHSKRLQKQKQIVQHDKITNGKASRIFLNQRRPKFQDQTGKTLHYICIWPWVVVLFSCVERSKDLPDRKQRRRWASVEMTTSKTFQDPKKEPNVSMSLIPNKEKHQHISKPSEPSVPSHWVILQAKPESQHIRKHKSAATANLQCFFRNQHSKTRKLK